MRKALALYLATEAAVHDSLSLVGGVTLAVAGFWFGWALIAWAVAELIIKNVAAYIVWHDKEQS